MRGASALGDLLEETPREGLRTYVVWLPVVESDDGPPRATVAAAFPSHVARQRWDPDLRIGLAAARALPETATKPCRQPTGRPDLPAISWDCALLFEPGATWDAEAGLPAPAWHGGAIERVLDELRRELAPK